MMLSPEAYYHFHLEGKSEKEILKIIKELKKEIKRLKEIIENPEYERTILPDELTQIDFLNEYILKAIETIGKLGGEYKPTKVELKVKEFNDRISDIKDIELTHGGYFDGWTTYCVSLVEKHIQIKEFGLEKPISIEIDKEDFIEKLKNIKLAEWRKNYDCSRYGLYICDGTAWDLKITFLDGRKKIYSGLNAYPYNFSHLLDLFSSYEEEYVEPYTIDEDVKNDFLRRMLEKAKSLENGANISTFELLRSISSTVDLDHHNYVFDGVEFQTNDLFSIDEEFKEKAYENGILIDDSQHAGAVVGIPYHLDFFVYKI